MRVPGTWRWMHGVFGTLRWLTGVPGRGMAQPSAHPIPDYKYACAGTLPSCLLHHCSPRRPALPLQQATTLPLPLPSPLARRRCQRCPPRLKSHLDPSSNHPLANHPPHQPSPHPHPSLPHQLQAHQEAHVYNSPNAFQPPTSHTPQWTTIGVPSPSLPIPALYTDAALMRKMEWPSGNLE